MVTQVAVDWELCLTLATQVTSWLDIARNIYIKCDVMRGAKDSPSKNIMQIRNVCLSVGHHIYATNVRFLTSPLLV